MAQHKMKQKTTLPKGAKQRSQKRIQQSSLKLRGPKKGALCKMPKKAAAIADAQSSAAISRIINEKNEETMRSRASQDANKQAPKR